MYRKIPERKWQKLLYEKEQERLQDFIKDNPGKTVSVYYSTYNTEGVGFMLIASIDKPKIKNKYICSFGNAVDITDYDERINEF